MKSVYNVELLKQIDEIVSAMSQNGMIEGSNFAKVCFDILEKEKWIGTKRNEKSEVIVAFPRENFEANLAGGLFSEQCYRRQIAANRRMVSHQYNVTNVNSPHSLIATGENIRQTILMDGDKLPIEDAINQIYQSMSLSNKEKEEVIDYLEELQAAYSNDSKPVNSTLRGLARWSERLITFGGSISSIYSLIKPILQPYL